MMLSLLVPLLLQPAGVAIPATPRATVDPPVHVWLSSDGRFEQGDNARVWVQTAQDGYLIVFRVDTEGHIRVLFPLDPGRDNFVRGQEKYEIRGRADRQAFTVAARSGSGIVFAAFSLDPFDFDGFVRGDHWDYGVMDAARDSESDPQVTLMDMAQTMVGPNGHYDYDVATYIAGTPRYYRTVPSYAGGCYACGPWGGYWGGYWGAFPGSYWGSCFNCYSPWYYGRRPGFGLFISFGRPLWYRSPIYRPFFPLFYRPRYVGYGLGFFGYGGWYRDGWYGSRDDVFGSVFGPTTGVRRAYADAGLGRTDILARPGYLYRNPRHVGPDARQSTPRVVGHREVGVVNVARRVQPRRDPAPGERHPVASPRGRVNHSYARPAPHTATRREASAWRHSARRAAPAARRSAPRARGGRAWSGHRGGGARSERRGGGHARGHGH